MTTETENVPAQVELTEADINAFRDSNAAMVTVTMPIAMKVKIDQLLAESGQDVSVSAFVRQKLAEAVGFALPAQANRGRVSKYATDQERKDAAARAAQERKDKFNALMERVKSGDIVL